MLSLLVIDLGYICNKVLDTFIGLVPVHNREKNMLSHKTYHGYCDRDPDPAGSCRDETVVELDPLQVVLLFPGSNLGLQFIGQAVQR